MTFNCISLKGLQLLAQALIDLNYGQFITEEFNLHLEEALTAEELEQLAEKLLYRKIYTIA
jgi:hypothetical protein